jgi:uncharacterized MAPEG superfamily protein
MVISYICVFMAAIMPYVFVGFAKSAEGYDNANPRESVEKMQGLAKRASGAQFNSFEAFPAFAVAVILAHLTGVTQSHITVLAVLFVLIRIVYGICYLTDKASLRTPVWFAGFLCVAILFIKAIMHAHALHIVI